MFERAAGKPRQNQRFPGAGIFQNAENLDLKILDFVAAEYGLASAVHARPQVFERHNVKGGMRGSEAEQAEGDGGKSHHPTSVIRVPEPPKPISEANSRQW